MKPNGLEIKAINPKNGDKFSPNLFKFLSSRRRKFMAEYAGVFKDDRGWLWLGSRDEGWFHGARLLGVLCNGRKEQTFAYPHLAHRLTEVPDFWVRYVRDGRCAIDISHDMYFLNDDNRWKVEGDHRTCRWCGRVRQRLERYVEKVDRERWVAA